MFRRPIAGVLLTAAALLLVGQAHAGNGTLVPTCRESADAIYALNGWRHKPQHGQLADCGAHHRYIAKRKARYWEYRAYRRVTPYRCQRGRFGTWAIPCTIIACESHFSWSAANSSGAVGPYQLLGWGAPYPARSFRAKLANHRIAARVYSGGAGRSNWVC